MRLFSLVIFLSIGITSFSQTNFPTEDSVHIFWQPNVKLTFEDYQGKQTPELKELMDKYNFSASASVGIWSVLDIPQKKKDRLRKFVKVYFAPAFDKKTSFAKSNDTLQIEMQNLYFDICEVWARWARKELQTLLDSSKATGTLSIWYMTIKNRMNNNRLTMYSAYFNDVFVNKRDGALVEWRKEIDKSLEDYKMWATTPQECYRLMTQKPIENGYIMAPKVVGSLDK